MAQQSKVQVLGNPNIGGPPSGGGQSTGWGDAIKQLLSGLGQALPEMIKAGTGGDGGLSARLLESEISFNQAVKFALLKNIGVPTVGSPPPGAPPA